jgi:hypothetical protein
MRAGGLGLERLGGIGLEEYGFYCFYGELERTGEDLVGLGAMK